jgi:O-antigen/teichoic acid export membrane protein
MLKGALYIYASKAFAFTIRLALPVLLVRVLSQTDYGIYRQFFLFEQTIIVFVQFGISQSLFYFIPRDRENAGSYLINTLGMNLLIYSLVFAALRLWSGPVGGFLNVPVLDLYFVELALFTLTMMLIVATDCYLLARGMAKQSALLEIIGTMVVSVATVIVAWRTHSLSAVILCLIVARSLRLLATLVYIHLRLKGFAARSYNLNIWPQIRYGVVLGLGGVLWAVIMRMHGFFVTRYFGTEAFAVYSVGTMAVPVLAQYQQSIASVVLGQFSDLAKRDDREGLRRLWNRIQGSLWGFGLPLIAGFLLVSGPLLRLLFPPEYHDAIPIFRVNVLTWLHYLFNAQFVLRALDRNQVQAWIHLAHIVAGVFVLYGAMKLWGMVGIIAGHCLLILSARVWAQLILNRISGLHLSLVPSLATVVGFYGEVHGKLRSRRWLHPR